MLSSESFIPLLLWKPLLLLGSNPWSGEGIFAQMALSHTFFSVFRPPLRKQSGRQESCCVSVVVLPWKSPLPPSPCPGEFLMIQTGGFVFSDGSFLSGSQTGDRHTTPTILLLLSPFWWFKLVVLFSVMVVFFGLPDWGQSNSSCHTAHNT